MKKKNRNSKEIEDPTTVVDESDLHEFDELDYDEGLDEDLLIEEYNETEDLTVRATSEDKTRGGSLVKSVKSLLGKVRKDGHKTKTDFISPLHKRKFKDKLIKQLPFLAKLFTRKAPPIKEEKPDSFDEMQSSGNKSTPKKKRISPLQAVIILGLVIFLIFDNEETPDPQPEVVAKKITPLKKKALKEPEAKSEVPPEPTQEVVKKTKLNNQGADEPEVEPSVSEELDSSPEVSELQDTESIAESEPESGPESNVDSSSEAEPEIEPSADSVSDNTNSSDEDTASDTTSDTALDTLSENTPIEEPVETSGSSNNNNPSEVTYNVDDMGLEVEDAQNSGVESDVAGMISDKILKSLEGKLKENNSTKTGTSETEQVMSATSAPSYENYGRALVYNCMDQHWACISIASFEQCQKNYSWQKNQGRSIECYPSEVLNSDYECSDIQQVKIDSVSETNFCSR